MSSHGNRLLRPSGGTPPPDSARVQGDQLLFLAPLAHEAALRHQAEFPDEVERYGPAGFAWCVHDLQYVLGWAARDATSPGLLEQELAWLTRLLRARGYDIRRLARSLELLGDVVAERHPAADDLARRLRAAANGV